ncbi:class I SAM-dependent methyltransferase [Paenibacillus spongiae]|uniref:Class I SAM-dependent methyltransferase n=1 Tax=Paenibacillus spongiae TaxID=2909671 RepID=A0ABY5S9Q4_9BACL|nr:class I SAM-dependent methyltransferase [Paenibacillus spongiae]UVI29448.1 class I SAM-dependent methyltransferase [Paenibacillus spongiae]
MLDTNGNYRGYVAETYDIWWNGDTFFDTQFYKRLMDEVPGMALEIGCGTGRLLLPYLSEGYEVEGVDCSDEMLDSCRKKAAEKDLSPVLYRQYMQELDLPKKYSTIFIPLASFMLVADRNEAMQALSKLYAHLEEGGQVIIPLFIPQNANKKEWTAAHSGKRHDGSDILVSSTSSIHLHEQVQTKIERYEIIQGHSLVETKFYTMKLRWYYKYEFTMMLEKFGFHDISIYGGYDGQPMNDDQTFFIFRARKQHG